MNETSARERKNILVIFMLLWGKYTSVLNLGVGGKKDFVYIMSINMHSECGLMGPRLCDLATCVVVPASKFCQS